MRKLGVTLLIVGIVVAAHFLVLKTMFKKNDSGKTDTPPPPTDEVVEGNEKPLAPVVKSSSPIFVFDYKDALFGDIPELSASSKSTTGILVDTDSGKVFWAKAPKRGVQIASMTKMMTSLLAFEDLKNRKDISMDSLIQVTQNAMSVGGSQLYLDVRESFSVSEMLRATMIMSANDAAELLAEFFSGGNTYEFIARMNRRARELKMPMTKFYNPHGLPGKKVSENNISSSEGMVILALELLKYPQAVEWASTKIDKLPRRNLKNPSEAKAPSTLGNHNHLLGVCPGVNGMKTGFTQSAGFCITATCDRGGKKMIAVATGFKVRKERDAFVAKLFDWGYKRLASSSISEKNIESDEFLDTVIPK